MTDVTIWDDKNQAAALVSVNGELVVGPISYSTAYHKTISTADTSFEIVPAVSGKKFIINSMLLATSKTFGTATTAETLTIYEASPADLSTNMKTVAEIDFLKNDRLVATGLDLASSIAVSLVAIATDTDVSVTIAGYYISANGED